MQEHKIIIARRPDAWARAALLGAGLALAGCDAPPGLWTEFNKGGFDASHNGIKMRVTPRDNPILMGTHVPNNETWEFNEPPTRGKPDTSWQHVETVGSGLIMQVKASRAIFGGRTKESNFNQVVGSSSIPVTMVQPEFSKTTAAWFSYPAKCQSLWDSSCKEFQSRPAPNQSQPFSFPFLIGDISLVNSQVNAGTPVLVTATLEDVKGNERGTVGRGFVSADASVHYVPVYVNILTDMNGNMGHAFMGGRSDTAAGRRELFRQIRTAFDDYAVDVLSKFREANSAVGYNTQLTRDVLNEHEGSSSFDSLVDGCQVQLRLEAVNFYKQSFGLERAMIGFGSAVSNLPFWSQSADAKMHQDANTMVQFITSGPPGGGSIDVWVAGEINPGTFAGFEGAAGIGFRASRGQPYAMLSARQNTTVQGGQQLLKHEVGHVLGLEHDSQNDGIRALFGRKLTSAMCSRIESQASQL